jgi:hypothetical protein
MADLTLAITGVGATGQLNSVGAPGLMALTLPAPKLSLTAAGSTPLAALTLPAPILIATGVGGALGAAALTLPTPQVVAGTPLGLTLPAPQLTASGTTGLAGHAALTLAAPQLVATGAVPFLAQAALTLAAPQLNAAGVTGVMVGANLTLRVPQLAATGNVPVQGDVALALPALQLAASGLTGVSGQMALTMRRLALAIGGATGVTGTAQLVLPVVEIGASGYENVVGAARLVLPHLQLVATGASAKAINAAASNTLVMHTETMGLTTYSNFPFNSFAAFNGVYLGAGDAGLFVLSGDTDNGALIQSAARVGITDFATSYLKRVDRVYVGYRTTGDLVLRIFTDEVTQRDYLLRATGDAGLHGNHVRLGKGLDARYWQFEVRNRAGADFELNMIELKPVKLRRRVGGRDA